MGQQNWEERWLLRSHLSQRSPTAQAPQSYASLLEAALVINRPSLSGCWAGDCSLSFVLTSSHDMGPMLRDLAAPRALGLWPSRYPSTCCLALGTKLARAAGGSPQAPLSNREGSSQDMPE